MKLSALLWTLRVSALLWTRHFGYASVQWQTYFLDHVKPPPRLRKLVSAATGYW
jgi:hypothetical protein